MRIARTSRAPPTRSEGSKLQPIARLIVISATLLAAVAASASAAGPTGFYGCRGFTAQHPAKLVRPRSIVVACGDGNLFLTGIRWRTWGAASATGSATLHQNDCKPYCAAGHFHAYPATLALSHPALCKRARVFMRIAWRSRGKSERTDFGCGTL